jgi:tRNA(fMet)-specific endonuclease VapC
LTRFLLDTNAVNSLLGKKFKPLTDRVLQYSEGEIGLPTIVCHELYFGAYQSQKISFNLETLRLLFGDFPILPFEVEDARVAGEIGAALTRVGTSVRPYDVLIAGQARARGLILVSNNPGEFERVSDLLLEVWTRL